MERLEIAGVVVKADGDHDSQTGVEGKDVVALPVGVEATGGVGGIAGGARQPENEEFGVGEVVGVSDVGEAVGVSDARGVGRQEFADADRARDRDRTGCGRVLLRLGPVPRRCSDPENREGGQQAQHQYECAPPGVGLAHLVLPFAGLRPTLEMVDMGLARRRLGIHVAGPAGCSVELAGALKV